RSPGAFDARQIEVLDDPEFTFSLSMDALPNPWQLENGFSLPIIEVYLSDARNEAGREELLPGSGMQLPAGEAWSYAFRLTGDDFQVFQAQADGTVRDVTEELGAALAVEGTTLAVTTNLPRPRRFSLYALVGSYDPFSGSGWRPLAAQPGPWSLSSPSQHTPVLDVLAERFSTQKEAIEKGVLPEIRSSVQYNAWLILTFLGLLLGLVGVVGRMLVRHGARPEPSMDLGKVEGADGGVGAGRYVPLELPTGEEEAAQPVAEGVMGAGGAGGPGVAWEQPVEPDAAGGDAMEDGALPAAVDAAAMDAEALAQPKGVGAGRMESLAGGSGKRAQRGPASSQEDGAPCAGEDRGSVGGDARADETTAGPDGALALDALLDTWGGWQEAAARPAESDATDELLRREFGEMAAENQDPSEEERAANLPEEA
ncbi:MAG TPA: glucodextranase DOMON-like domain-containing protein, partial [Trueperaceae bacterium]